jgi:hypothetical protein
MKNFFGALQRLHNNDLREFTPIEETEEFKELESDYCAFCSTGLVPRSIKSVREDLAELLSVPGITHVAFRYTEEGLELLLGTVHVYITDPYSKKTYNIGEFIIRISRQHKRVLFQNITQPLMRPNSETSWKMYHHPHVPENGLMCIDMNTIHEYLTEGKMGALARLLVRALHTVDNHPYPDAYLSHWPQEE